MEAASRVTLVLLCGTDGSHGPSPLTSLIPWFKNTPCQSLCFYFLVGKSWCCQTPDCSRELHRALISRGKCLFTEANSAKFGPGLRPARGGRGGGVLRFRSGWDFMYLAWNDPTRLSSDQTLSFPTCELINVTSAGTVVYSWTYLCPIKNLFSSNGLYFGSIEQ